MEELGADASVMAGISALTGAIHGNSTQAGSLAGLSPRAFRARLASIVSCGTPAPQDSCATGGIKSAVYTSCTTSLSHKYEGSIVLDYSENGCGLGLEETVTRLVTMNRTLQFSSYPRFNGTVVFTTSENHTDYRGAQMGGGSLIRRVSVDPVFDMEVSGIHKVLKNTKNRTAYDISIRTISPIQITGDLSGDRTAKGGELEVIHNQAQYVATFSPSNLRYNSTTCCHPVAGTVTAVFSGKAVGQGTIAFTGTCGFATLDRGNGTVEIPLHGCE